LAQWGQSQPSIPNTRINSHDTAGTAMFYLQYGKPKWVDAMVWQITDPKFLRKLPQYKRFKKAREPDASLRTYLHGVSLCKHAS